jgi:hypothetical protein
MLMKNWREQLPEKLRRAEQERDLLRELEHNLSEENRPELESQLTQLEQLAQSYPEGHSVRLLLESAVRSELVGDVSRARSAIEGEISTLQGALRYGAT